MSNFDKRVLDRNLKRGVISQKEYEKSIEAEEDCSDNLENSEVRFVHKIRDETEEKKEN